MKYLLFYIAILLLFLRCNSDGKSERKNVKVVYRQSDTLYYDNIDSLLNHSDKSIVLTLCDNDSLQYLPDIISNVKLVRLVLIRLPKFKWNENLVKLSKNKNIEELYFKEMSINKPFPKEISLITSLKKLEIFDDSITDIPKEIGNMTNLEYIDIYVKGMKKMPDEFCNLSKLRYLSLNISDLKRLPINFYRLEHLRVLDLSYCNFTSIPAEVMQIKNLEELYFSNNPLTSSDSIPQSIYKLKKLKVFRIASTPLAHDELEYGNKYRKYHTLQELVDSMPKCKIQLGIPSEEVPL